MSDRELLELAAKAAGVGPLSWIEPDGTKIVTNVRWNPLTDDGDALRLAVKLRMRVSAGQVDWVGNEYVGEFSTLEEVASDPLAATRRAIVRAAAEIGKGMK